MIETAIFPGAAAARDDGYKTWQGAARTVVMRHDLNDRTAGPIPSFGKMIHETALAAQTAHPYAPADSLADTARPDISYDQATTANDDSLSFGDILDIFNPLQHLPVLGTMYRKWTGDTMKPFSNIIGGAIFGGPVGAMASTVNVVVKEGTGKDIAENALSFMGFNAPPKDSAAVNIRIDGQASNQTLDQFGPDYKNLTTANLSSPSAKNFAAINAYQKASWNS